MIQFERSITNHKNITNGSTIEESITTSTKVVIDVNPLGFIDQLSSLF